MCHSQGLYRPTRLPDLPDHLGLVLLGPLAVVRQVLLGRSALPGLKASRACQATQDPWGQQALKASARKALQ